MPVFIGLDFGTSCTKIVVRLPYEAGEPTIAIPAPVPCRSGNDPYFWQTVLWLDKEGTFVPWPEPGLTTLHTLKQGLIQGRSEQKIRGLVTALAVDRSQAAAAYLAFAIRYAKGWLLRFRPELFRRRTPVWHVNLGMPAASYDDQELAVPYQRAGAAAILLAGSSAAVTIASTKKALGDRRVEMIETSGGAEDALAVDVVPEAAAEMTAFAKSARGAPGLYLLVDVGALTLDACAFRLVRKVGGDDAYAFMAARVQPLGVDSYYWFRSEGKTKHDFIQQCNRALKNVVWSTRQHRDPNSEVWKPGSDLPVFLAGGGAANRLHRSIVESLGEWLTRHTRNDGIRLLELEVPESIELPETLNDFGRMAVAWGLSYPRDEIGKIRPMRVVEDIQTTTVVDLGDTFISKDQV